MPNMERESRLPALPADVSLSREMRLLLACSWIPPEPRKRTWSEEFPDLCGGEIDWNVFLKLVHRHRIPPLAHAALGKFAGDRVPEAVRLHLQERDKAQRLRAMAHSVELARMAKLFSAAGIDLLPLKGTPLSEQLYGDFGLRQSKDIDFYIRPEDMERADALLLAERYRRTFPRFDPTPRQKEYLLTCYKSYNYSHPKTRIEIELHGRIYFWRSEHYREIWDHAGQFEWRGSSFKRLDDATLFLFLCDHGASHKWFRAKWLGEVASLMAGYSGADWDRAIDLAERWDLLRPLCETALLAHWLYGVTPGERVAALMDRHTPGLAIQCIKALLSTEEEYVTRSFLRNWKEMVYLFRLRKRPAYGDYLQKLFTDPEAVGQISLPDRLFWLHYPLRLFYYFRRHYL